MNYHLCGWAVWGYHLTNLLLHLTNAVLVTLVSVVAAYAAVSQAQPHVRSRMTRPFRSLKPAFTQARPDEQRRGLTGTM